MQPNLHFVGPLWGSIDLQNPRGADGLAERRGAVILESLRLSPPARLFLRKLTAPFTPSPYRFSANRQIMLSPWVAHRNRAFQRHRDLTARALGRCGHADGVHPLPRWSGTCAGPAVAMLDATVVMAMVRAQNRVELPPHAATEPAAFVTKRLG